MAIELKRSRIFYLCISLAIIFWIIDPIVHALLLGEGTLTQQILDPRASEVWMRSLISCLLIVVGIYADFQIRKQKELEEVLRSRESEFLTLFGNATEALVKTSFEGKVILANLAFARMLGYESPEDVISVLKDLKTQLYVDQNRHKELTDLLQKQKELKNAEVEFYRRDGSRIWCTLNTRLVCKTNSEISHYQSVVSDITERKQAWQTFQETREDLESRVTQRTAQLTQLNRRLSVEIGQRKEKEKQLSESQHVAKIGSWNRDLKTNQISWSEGLYQIFGVRKEESPTNFENFLELVIPEDRERIKEELETAIEQKSAQGYDFRIKRPDGEIRHLHSIGRFELNELGKPVRMFGIAQDITDLKKEETARLKTEARYASILDGSVDAIISVDRNERVIVFNKGAEATFGYSEKEILGQPLEILIPEDRCKSHKRAFAEFRDSSALSRLMGARAEVAGKRKNGKVFPAEASITRQNVEGELVLTAVLRDITERKKIEQQILKAQKVEAVGMLAGGIAHDFNNSMSALLMNCEMAVSCLEPGHPEIQECQIFLKEMNYIAEHASGLTQQLLAFSNKEVVERRVIRIDPVLSNITEMLRRLIREDIKLEIITGSGLYSVNASESHIERIIVNLAVNGRDAMPKGGVLRVKVENVEVSEPIPEAKVTPGKYVLMTVEDTGMGMSKETLEEIFEPFFTTKPVGQGTGLGLATVWRVVTEMDAIITVSSILGKGTQFMIYMPAVDSNPEDIQSVQQPGSRDRAKGETILYCEDDKPIRVIVERFVKKEGYTVLTAEDGATALEMAKSHGEAIDLLITDVVMPGMNGKELADQTSKLLPSMKVLFVSGYATEVLNERDIIPESMSFIAKPFNSKQLLQRIDDLLQ